MSTPFQAKIAFVTGGAAASAPPSCRLARDGATVAFTYRESGAAARALAAEIEAQGGRALAIQADAGDAAALAQAIDDTAARFGRIDILVNNAGVLRLGALDSFTLEDFDRTLEVNVRAVFVAAKAVLRTWARAAASSTSAAATPTACPSPAAAPMP